MNKNDSHFGHYMYMYLIKGSQYTINYSMSIFIHVHVLLGFTGLFHAFFKPFVTDLSLSHTRAEVNRNQVSLLPEKHKLSINDIITS